MLDTLTTCLGVAVICRYRFTKNRSTSIAKYTNVDKICDDWFGETIY